ncbi:MAG: hypothetical protein WCR45_02730 [Bacteroidaceae bacterium]|nr:hypothetical protein [Bacilli bacterium]
MKAKKSILCILTVGLLALTGCNNDSTSTTDSTQGESTSLEETTSAGYTPDLSKKVTLDMSVMYKDLSTRMKFNEAGKAALPYTAPNGTPYDTGDFKPVWKELQKRMNIEINDVTSTNAGDSISDAFATYQTNAFADENIAQGHAADIIAEGTTNSTILNLGDYLDKMPNFNAFLEENPVIKSIISDANGDIFYAPYFDGFNDAERCLNLRTDWVEELLDGEAGSYDTVSTISNKYTRFGPASVDTNIEIVKDGAVGSVHKKYASGGNIIDIQNALTNKTGDSLVKALRDYIDTTYQNAYGTKRSDLFIGANAAYDVDELVALFRCVKTNPTFLTGDGSTDMVPLFPRASRNDRVAANLWGFMQFFGDRGVDSRNGFLFVNSEGKLSDSRGEETNKIALSKMNELYGEGLILPNFTTKGTVVADSEDFRGGLFQQDRGFATYDYVQTTCAYDNDATCAKLNGGKFNVAPVLPAVYNWNGDSEYFHYTESWRSVKTDGWFITAHTADDEDILNRCLAVFDYFWSEEGNRLMSYGPDEYLAKDSTGGIKTMDYQGKQVPVLSDDCKQELQDLAGGNYTNYYRYYLGATYPIGYIKQQGMEYQTVAATARPFLDNMNKAIELGVLKHVNFKTDNNNSLYDIVPTTLSLNKAEQTALATNFTELSTQINKDKKKSCVYSNIVMEGFGTYGGYDFSYDKMLDTINTTLNLTGFLQYENDGYARMGL